MQVLIEKNTQLSQELEECKAQLEAALAAAGEPKATPLVIYASKDKYFAKCGVGANLTNEIVDGARLKPEVQQLRR